MSCNDCTKYRVFSVLRKYGHVKTSDIGVYLYFLFGQTAQKKETLRTYKKIYESEYTRNFEIGTYKPFEGQEKVKMYANGEKAYKIPFSHLWKMIWNERKLRAYYRGFSQN